MLEAEAKARVVHTAEQDMADLIGSSQQDKTVEAVLEQGAPDAVMAAYVNKHWPDLVGLARTAGAASRIH